MTEYQALQDEIAQAIADCDDDETAALAEVVMPVVDRELAARDAVIEQIRALAETLKSERKHLLAMYDRNPTGRMSTFGQARATGNLTLRLEAILSGDLPPDACPCACCRDSNSCHCATYDAHERCDCPTCLSALPSTEDTK